MQDRFLTLSPICGSFWVSWGPPSCQAGRKEVQQISWFVDHYVMVKPITTIAVTGILATVGLTFAMNQALQLQPDRMGEGEVKAHFRLRFRPHSESEPRLQIKPGSVKGKIQIKAWIEPKITEDRHRLGFTLRNFLWGAPYKSGRPETVWLVVRDPVTGKSTKQQVFELEVKRTPRQGTKSSVVPGMKNPLETKILKPGEKPKDQSVLKDRSGKGFKSQSSSSKIK